MLPRSPKSEHDGKKPQAENMICPMASLSNIPIPPVPFPPRRIRQYIMCPPARPPSPWLYYSYAVVSWRLFVTGKWEMRELRPPGRLTPASMTCASPSSAGSGPYTTRTAHELPPADQAMARNEKSHYILPHDDQMACTTCPSWRPTTWRSPGNQTC
jgi:hypothetical protein